MTVDGMVDRTVDGTVTGSVDKRGRMVDGTQKECRWNADRTKTEYNITGMVDGTIAKR